MNYTQAYKTLRAYGLSAGEARRLLDTAETGPLPGMLEQIIVSFDDKVGFTITEEN